MARVTFSPLIASMSGKTADAVFASWKGRNYVRQLVIPHNPRSAAQTLVRNSLTYLVAMWQLLSSTLKDAYQAGGDQFNYSGYNDFISMCRAELQAGTGIHGPRRNPDYAGDYIQIPTDMAIVDHANVGSCNATWTDPGQGADYRLGLLYYDDTDHLFHNELINAMAMSAETSELPGFTTGHDYLIAAFVHRLSDTELVHIDGFAVTPT